MKQTVNFTTFTDAFNSAGRYDNFGYDGLQALFDYLERLEQDIGEELELDVIAICCDFSLYTLEELNSQFSSLRDGDDWESIEDAQEVLQDHTTVIPVDEDSLIVQDF